MDDLRIKIKAYAYSFREETYIKNIHTVNSAYKKGLGSLTINFCPANMENFFFTKSFKILQWLQNITYLQ